MEELPSIRMDALEDNVSSINKNVAALAQKLDDALDVLSSIAQQTPIPKLKSSKSIASSIFENLEESKDDLGSVQCSWRRIHCKKQNAYFYLNLDTNKV